MWARCGGSRSARTRVPVRGHAGPGAARHLESSTGGKIHLRSKLVVCRRRLRGGREELEVRKINLE